MSAWNGPILSICYTILAFMIYGPTEFWNVLPRSLTPSTLMGTNWMLSNRFVGWGKVTHCHLIFSSFMLRDYLTTLISHPFRVFPFHSKDHQSLICFLLTLLFSLRPPLKMRSWSSKFSISMLKLVGKQLTWINPLWLSVKMRQGIFVRGISTIFRIPNMNGKDKFLGLSSVIPC